VSGSLDFELLHAGAQCGFVQPEAFGRVASTLDLPSTGFQGSYDVSPLHVLEGVLWIDDRAAEILRQLIASGTVVTNASPYIALRLKS